MLFRSNEQSSGIAGVNVAIGNLDQMTQQNAAMVEETTAASQVLAGEASGEGRLREDLDLIVREADRLDRLPR